MSYLYPDLEGSKDIHSQGSHPIESTGAIQLPAKGKMGLSKQVAYYQKYKDSIAALASTILNIGDQESVQSKLAAKVQRKMTKMDVMLSGESPADVTEQKLNTLMSSVMKLHREYMQILAAESEKVTAVGIEESLPIIPYEKIPVFLKRLEKLDRMLRNGEGLDHEFVDEMLYFSTRTTVSLDDMILRKLEGGSASVCYFVSDEGSDQKIMVFKPISGDAQVFPTIPRGESFKRQMAAYLIDRDNHGQLNVPLSALGATEEAGLGSVQVFRKNQGEVRDLTGSQIRLIPIEDLHRVSIHRSRLYELDGHLGNLLYREKEGRIELIPIDFDYILPEIRDRSDMDTSSLKISWRYFPQMDDPLSAELKKYLTQMDVAHETTVLNGLGLPECTQRLHNMAAWAWQIGAASDLTPGQIIDYLDSEDFKELYLWQNEELPYDDKFSETIQDYLKTSIASYVEKLQEDTQLYDQAKLLIDSGEYDDAIYIMKSLFESNENRRLAFQVMRDLILAKAPLEKCKEVLEFFKDYFRLSPNEMYAGILSFIYAFEEIGAVKEAEELRQWTAWAFG